MLLAGLVVLAVVGPVGSGDRSSDTGPAGGQDTLPTTDAAAPASNTVRGLSEAVRGSSEDDGWVTGTTLRLPTRCRAQARTMGG